MRTIPTSLTLIACLAFTIYMATPIPRLTAETAPEDEAKADVKPAAEDYERLCQLPPDVALKRIAPPFPPSRLVYYQTKEEQQAAAIPRGPDNIFFRWDNGKLSRWGMSFAGGNGTGLQTVLRMLTNLYPQDIVGDEEVKGLNVPGDFVVNVDASAEDVVKRLQQILNEEMDADLTLAFVEIEREVYVARGEYALIPIDPQRRRVEIYGERLNENPRVGGGGSGDLDKFLMWVGMWIERPVVSAIESPPKEQISWHYNLSGPYTEEQRLKAKDPELVLENITQQTGLTFDKQRRKMRVLIAENNN